MSQSQCDHNKIFGLSTFCLLHIRNGPMCTGELVLDEVVEPELLEAEQDGDVEFVPEAGVEQDHEMFQETEGYEEQWDNYPETDWEVAENDFYEDNLSPFLLF